MTDPHAELRLQCSDALVALGAARHHVAGFGRDDLLAHIDTVRDEIRRIRDAHTPKGQ